MTTDRELLEAAAKAMGEKVPPRFFDDGTACLLSGQHWNPLLDDGDAFRLAVRLLFRVDVDKTACVVTYAWKVMAEEPVGNDGPLAATRRAIVRAAAALGERG